MRVVLGRLMVGFALSAAMWAGAVAAVAAVGGGGRGAGAGAGGRGRHVDSQAAAGRPLGRQWLSKHATAGSAHSTCTIFPDSRRRFPSVWCGAGTRPRCVNGDAKETFIMCWSWW